MFKRQFCDGCDRKASSGEIKHIYEMLLGTSASLLVTGATLLGTRNYQNNKLLGTSAKGGL